MKHKRAYVFLLFSLLLSAICITGQKTNASAADDSSAPMDIVTLTDGDGSEKEYEVTPVQLRYNGNSQSYSVTPIQADGIWLIPVKSVLSDLLGCSYSYSEEEKSIQIKTPGRDKSITFIVNSDTALVNNVPKSMPAKMLQAVQKSTGNTDYMVPLKFAMDNLSYFSYSVQDAISADNIISYIIEINCYYLFHKEDDEVSYDEEKYNNTLVGIAVTENDKRSKNYVLVSAAKELSKNDVVITQNTKESSITVTYLKTFNPFGNTSEEIKSNIVRKIETTQNEQGEACVVIYFNAGYVFASKVSGYTDTLTFSKGSFSLKVIMPEDVEFSDITTTDQYWNKKFLIIIPGNHVSFYKEHGPFINSTVIKKVAVGKNADGDTKITVSTDGLKGYKLTEEEGYFTVKVGSPKSIYQNIVLLDAGHGGKDNGASKSGLKEKKLCLAILYTQAKQYFESNDSTVKAYWTRHDDTFINLYTRPALTKTYQADLFVSLHMNSASNTSANGTEVYYSKANNKKNSAGLTSKKFATRMKDTLVDTLGNKDRGVKQAGFVVNKYNTVPSILIELGFLTGKTDAKRLKKESYQERAAEAIYQEIADTFEAFPTGR